MREGRGQGPHLHEQDFKKDKWHRVSLIRRAVNSLIRLSRRAELSSALPRRAAATVHPLLQNNLSARIVNHLLAPTPMSIMIDKKAPGNGGFQAPPPKAASTRPVAEPSQSSTVVTSVRLDTLMHADAIVELWHIDVEGAEIPVLQSASGLLRAGRIKRVIFEVSRGLWHKYNIPSAEEGYRQLREIFEGWRCTWACNAKPFPFRETGFGKYRCSAPWVENQDLGWGGGAGHDVFCVAPSVDFHETLWATPPPSAGR